MIRLLIISLIVIAMVTGCQKGIHWDIPSAGSLGKDSAGNCMPVSISGTYITHKAMNDSNFMLVTVNITKAGTYSITSDRINGYVFSAQGVFDHTGTTNVKIHCNGTPVMPGTNHLNIYYNNSFCETPVTVLSDSVPDAEYNLEGAPDACLDYTTEGNYIENIALDTSAKVSIRVNVVSTGKYSISTQDINGYSFSGAGNFIKTGPQVITLKGKGQPVHKGIDLFNITTGTSACSFTVTVVPLASASGNLHLPLSAGSYWVYEMPGLDTINRYINGDTLINDTAYIRMSEIRKYTPQTYFYNLTGNKYKEFAPVDRYNSSFWYDPPVYSSLPILQENLSQGDDWESPTYKGIASFGQVLYIKYRYYCFSVSGTISVNGYGFKDVYIIGVYPMLKSEDDIWGNTNEVYYRYYAKGVGLVYETESINNNTPFPILKIINWKVN